MRLSEGDGLRTLRFKISDSIQFSETANLIEGTQVQTFKCSSFILRLPKSLSPDTSPEVERIMIEGSHKMSAWKKLQQVLELTQLVQQLADE